MRNRADCRLLLCVVVLMARVLAARAESVLPHHSFNPTDRQIASCPFPHQIYQIDLSFSRIITPDFDWYGDESTASSGDAGVAVLLNDGASRLSRASGPTPTGRALLTSRGDTAVSVADDDGLEGPTAKVALSAVFLPTDARASPPNAGQFAGRSPFRPYCAHGPAPSSPRPPPSH